MGRFTENQGISRRAWLKDVATPFVGTGLLAACNKQNSQVAKVTGREHRLNLALKPLQAVVVDNHDGLGGKAQQRRRGEIPEASGNLGRLSCTVPFEERFNGYNGICLLRHGDSLSPFLPSASGLNCEFIFDEEDHSYEPRWTNAKEYDAQPSRLEKLSPSSARLLIDPGPRWGVRVEMRFELVRPFYLDIEHAFTAQRPTALRRFLGVFWANYIQVPRLPAFSFIAKSPNGRERWIKVNQALGSASRGVIAPEHGPVGEAFRREPSGLIYGVAETRYVQPFFCGEVHDMLLGFMFRCRDDLELRFAYNSQGGGPGVPAWDYQAVVPQPEANRRYSFKVRVFYKPFTAIQEAAELYQQWKRVG